MQKVRLHTLTESVQPARSLRASIPLSQRSGTLPVSHPVPVAPHAAYSSGSSPLSPPMMDNVYGVSSPSPPILAVDDSLTIRKIVETTARRQGYVAITFPDGVTALRWLAEASYPVPKLVLLDIELPKLDGYAIARGFKAKPALESTTIIMMSRHDGVMDRLKGRLAGAEGHLSKPFKTAALVEIMRRYLGNTMDALVDT